MYPFQWGILLYFKLEYEWKMILVKQTQLVSLHVMTLGFTGIDSALSKLQTTSEAKKIHHSPVVFNLGRNSIHLIHRMKTFKSPIQHSRMTTCCYKSCDFSCYKQLLDYMTNLCSIVILRLSTDRSKINRLVIYWM